MEHKAFLRYCPESGNAVLLIHGICGSPVHFQQLLPLIPDNWSVYNLLLDGHGAGVKEFGKSSMSRWKQQLSEQLDEIFAGHARVLVIGHSMGTLLAMREAVARKDADMRLFLLNCPLRIQYPPRTMLMSLRVAMGKIPDSDEKGKAMAQCCGIQLTKKLWQYISWILRFLELFSEVRKTRRELPCLKTPCACYQGKLDELVPVRASRVLSRNPGIRVTVLEDSSHYFYAPKDLTLLQDSLKHEIDQMRLREEV